MIIDLVDVVDTIVAMDMIDTTAAIDLIGTTDADVAIKIVVVGIGTSTSP